MQAAQERSFVQRHLALIVAAVALVLAIFLYRGGRAFQSAAETEAIRARVQSSNPMRAADSLAGLPTLILTGTGDMFAPEIANGGLISPHLGASCQYQLIVGAAHGDPRTYDVPRIVTFLKKNVPAGAKIVLLHDSSDQLPRGGDANGYDWDTLPAGKTPERPYETARSELARQLKAQYKVMTGAFGGDSWGNPAAQDELERALGPTEKVAFVSEGMGALLMWNWAEKYPKRVLALVGISPVCDLERMVSGSAKQAIQAAYPQ